MLAIPAFERHRQEDHKSKLIIGHIASVTPG